MAPSVLDTLKYISFLAYLLATLALHFQKNKCTPVEAPKCVKAKTAWYPGANQTELELLLDWFSTNGSKKTPTGNIQTAALVSEWEPIDKSSEDANNAYIHRIQTSLQLQSQATPTHTHIVLTTAVPPPGISATTELMA